jgi:hypothetical protein
MKLLNFALLFNTQFKSLQIQKENCPEPDPQALLKPRMWIITPTLSKPKLALAGAKKLLE